MKKINVKSIIFIVIMVLTCIFRIVLQSMVPIYPMDNFIVDDLLMVRYANWMPKFSFYLGDYDQYTLNKPSGYVLFLKINNVLNTRYMVLLGIVYCLAGLLFFLAVYSFSKSKIKAYICFVVALYCPVMMDFSVAGRVYCISLIPMCTMLIVTGFIGALASRKNKLKMLFWLLLSGLVYAYYMTLRYDYIWLSCFMLGAGAVIIALYFIENKKNIKLKEIILRVLLCFLPFIMGIVSTNILCMINYKNYGIYATNDFNETNFAKMCNLLMKIEPKEEKPGVYVSVDTLERAAAVSPNLSILIEERKNKGWANRSLDGEMPIEFYAWNLRYAGINIGLYADAKLANDFYGEICDDLERAFDNGTFKKRKAITVSPFSAPLLISDIPDLLDYSFKKGIKSVVSYDSIIPGFCETVNPSYDEAPTLFEEYTNEELISPDEMGELAVSGWMYALNPDDKLEFSLMDENGNIYNVDFLGSPDVYDAYKVESAKMARYAVRVDANTLSGNDAKVRVSLNGKVVFETDFEEFNSFSEIPGCNGCVETKILPNKKEKVINEKKNIEKNLKFLNNTLKVLKKFAMPVFWICILIFMADIIMNIIFVIKKKSFDFLPFILKLGMFMTMWANVLMQAERNFSGNIDFTAYYSAGAFMMYHIFMGLCIITLIDMIKKIYCLYKNKDDIKDVTTEA